MKKKIISAIVITVLTLTLTVPTSFATTQEELKNQLEQKEQERENISSDLAQVEKDMKSLQEKVDNLNAEIEVANEKIADKEMEIQQKQAEMQDREDGLNERLRAMYKNGSIGFLDVLLGSNSVSELITNLELVKRIYENDMNILSTLEQEAEELGRAKAQLQIDKDNLDGAKAELEVNQTELSKKKATLEAAEDSLEEEAAAIRQEIINMNLGGDYVGGSWVWPAPASKYVTSPYGNRLHPVHNKWKFHSGIDIGASGGTNVVAAAAGTVIKSMDYGNTGYGECIMIDHGGGIVTLYGHMRRGTRRVAVGDTVAAGQVIALVGSTGTSTGPHLHFEVIVNGSTVDPLGYVS